MPESTAKLLAALGAPETALSGFGTHPGGQTVETLPPLFPKPE
jgi:hypothetical protein